MVEAGAETEQERPLELTFPPGVFSLSHVALPFPLSDGLYGLEPDPDEDFGIRLGTIAARGERGALIVSLDTLLRMSSNPFFPYLLGRIEEGIGANAARPAERSSRTAEEAGKFGPVILATAPGRAVSPRAGHGAASISATPPTADCTGFRAGGFGSG